MQCWRPNHWLNMWATLRRRNHKKIQKKTC